MLLMIDNYDSFTYNIVQYFGQLGEDVQVHRNDRITLAEIEDLSPARLVISRLVRPFRPLARRHSTVAATSRSRVGAEGSIATPRG